MTLFFFTLSNIMCFVAGEEWKKLSQADRAPYDKGAQEEQRKYEVKLAEWRKVGP